MKISNFVEEPITLNIPNKYTHLAPNILDNRCEFRLHGVNNAIAGSLIRTMCGEMSVNYLKCEYDDLETNDIYIIPEMVINRIMMIPINQSIPIGTNYVLSYTNDTPFLATIKTSLIAANNNAFNKNMTICKLNKGKKIKISMTVASAFSYIPTFGGLSLAYQGVAIPIDHDGSGKESEEGKAFKQYENTGIKTSVSKPTMYDISFKTHIGASCRGLLRNAIGNIIERIRRVRDFIPTRVSIGNKHTYRIIDEGETIGNLFERYLIDNFPKIGSAMYNMDLDMRIVNIMIYSNEITDDIMVKTINDLIITFEKIKKLFA
jgi:hypothetical protein